MIFVEFYIVNKFFYNVLESVLKGVEFVKGMGYLKFIKIVYYILY